MYGVAVYPLDLARAEAAVELHRRSAGSGLAVDVADLTGCSGRRRFVLARQLVEGFPVGGDHVGDFEEGATDLLLLGDEGRMVEAPRPVLRRDLALVTFSRAHTAGARADSAGRPAVPGRAGGWPPDPRVPPRAR